MQVILLHNSSKQVQVIWNQKDDLSCSVEDSRLAQTADCFSVEIVQ